MSFPFPETHTYRDANDPSVLISFDNRYFPLVIAKPHKGWAEDAVRYYFETWRATLAAQAHKQGVGIVIILDIRSSTVPPATVRKTAGELTATDKNTKGLFRTLVVVDNPMLRGVITAIMWLAGDAPVSFVGTLPEGLKGAFREFEAKGVEHPQIDPATYTFPIAT
jgi:hypothetical protein